MDNSQLKQYLDVVIPNIENELTIEKDPKKLLDLYNLYRDVLFLVAPHDFITYNKAIEFEEDKTRTDKGFYHHRKKHMGEMFEAFNDIEVNDKYDKLLISMPPRTGKEQPMSARILTAYGWTTMSEVYVGMPLMGEDGKPYKVTGVFPQGVKRVYELVTNTGLRVPCGIDHLWRVKTPDDIRPDRTTPGGDRIMTTREIIEYKTKNKARLYIENIKSMDYPTKINQEIIDLYSLGVMLGEGTLPYSYIPRRYLFCDYEARLDLLRGIMDRSADPVWTKTSLMRCVLPTETLAIDVCDLVRSFGGRAKHKYQRVDANMRWVVHFSLSVNPFYRELHSKRFVPMKRGLHGHIIKEVVDTGRDEECQCISVDNPTHMYVTDGYIPTHNTTTGIRFLSWIMGRHPESTQLATSYSDGITVSFYKGAIEIVQSEEFKKIFPESPLVDQNAKREEIWLKVKRRYPSITFAPIGGSITGRTEAEKYLYCDDLIANLEEAMNVNRVNKIWDTYTTDLKQRKKDGCKEVHLATQWSVHDVISKLHAESEDDPRIKSIRLPAYDEQGESNFDFYGGFSKEYYKDIEKTMDSVSFNAIYVCEAIEREGLLYHKEDMQTYFDLPDEPPDTIIAVCDSKNVGKDNVAAPVGYVYGDLIFIEDVVFDPGLPAVTIPRVAELFTNNNVVRADIEMNNGGGFYAENVDAKIKEFNGKTSIRTFFTSTNKNVKIITYSDYVTKHFVFKDPSKYSNNSDYAKFMKNVYAWSQTTKTQVDDAPDSLAMLANLFQNLQGSGIRIVDRKRLGI